MPMSAERGLICSQEYAEIIILPTIKRAMNHATTCIPARRVILNSLFMNMVGRDLTASLHKVLGAIKALGH